MSKYIDADYNQSHLFPPCLEDFVGNDHPARFIREFVDAIDLEKEGFSYHPETVGKGTQPYSPRLLLCGWIYGYMEKIRSTRAIEKACLNNLGMMWIMGMHKPDHNTFWRFWNQNRKAIKKIFKKTVTLSLNAGLIDFAFHALDGTKLMSFGSKQKTLIKSKLEKQLKEIDTAIDEIFAETLKHKDNDNGEYKLKKNLQEKETLKKTIEEGLVHLAQHETSQLHKKDTDARMMKMKSGNKEMCYNAQIVTEPSNGIIVAAKVVNDQNDQKLLNTMLKEAQANLGKLADENIADSGYDTEEELYKAQENQFSVIVNRANIKAANKNIFHKKHFKFDEEENVFICPHTQEKLIYEKTQNRPEYKDVEIFRCKNKGCEMREQCSKQKRGKSIEKSKHYLASQYQDEKQKEPSKKKLLKIRKQVVELSFAHIKEHASFRRTLFMGLDKVQTQWSFVCAIQNLKKLYKHWSMGSINTV